MKRKQWTALALSTILLFSAWIPAAGTSVYAAENGVTQETAFEGADPFEVEVSTEDTDFSVPAGTAGNEGAEFDAAGVPASDSFEEAPSGPADAAADEDRTILTEDGPEEAVSEKGLNSSIEPTEENFANAAVIAAGDVVDVNITGEAPAFFRFTPEETGVYTIYSTSEADCDPALILYDGSGSRIGQADDEEESNFRHERLFDAGIPWYLQAYCYNEEASFQIHIEKRDTAFYVQNGGSDQYLYVVFGNEVTVEAQAVSSSPLSYQWYLNGTPVTGETSPAFTFTPESNCEVFCTVSDGEGNSENVFYEIFFDTGLMASAAGSSTFSLDPGASQTLAVEASANEGIELSYRWFNRTTGVDIAGDSEDPAKCTIENLQSYTEVICYVSDPYGQETLVWFYLRVNGDLPVWPGDGNPGEDSHTYTVAPGSSYHLWVDSNTETALSCAWYDENDTLLQESDSTGYALENIQETRTIHCHVSAADNPDIARDLYFHVKLQVEITLRPEADINCEDLQENNIWLNILNHDEVTLRAVVETTGETEGMTYQWFKEEYDEDGYSEWSAVTDAVSDSLTIPLPVSGSYYCEARDAEGNNAFAYYYLTGDGWISAYDSKYSRNSVTLDADTLESPALDLSVTADCYADDRLTYQWYRQSGDGYAPIEGAVSSSYTLKNPQNGTSYYCLADSGYGGQDTVYYYFRRDNNLSVYADDTKNSNELTLDPRRSDSFTLTPVVEADDTENLSYLWTYTGSNGKQDPADSTGASLTVTGPENLDGYNCQVTDLYGNTASACYQFLANTHLEVYAEGDTRKDNVFYINISGMDSLTLTGVADVDEGTPLTWSWEKNDAAIDGKSGTFTGGGQSSLQVNSPAADDIYRFRAEDNLGNYDYVDFCLVSETTPLRIYPDGGNEGDDSIDVNLTFEQNPAELCVSVAECINGMALKYVWKNEAGEVLYEAFEDSTYSIYDPVDGAKYSCTAIDQFGQEATVWFTLHVELDPSGPTKEEFENAQKIRAGETAKVILKSADDYRMFRFTAEKDGLYLFYSSDHSGNQDPQAWLYRQDFRSDSYSDDEGGNWDFLIARACKAGETCYLKAYDRGTGTYSLHLEETDLYAAAYNSAERTEYIGSEPNLSVLAYSVSELHYQWYEGDADGTEASFKEIEGANGPEYTYTVERTSSFRCRVTDDEGHSKDIVFRVTAEVDHSPKNSDFENARELKAGNPVRVSLTDEKYADYYRFTADEAGRYRFTASEDDGDNDPTITIYRKTIHDDDEGEAYDSYYEHSSGYQSNKDDLDEGETIYLRICRDDYQPGNFTLKAEFLPFWAEASSEASPNVHYGESVDLTVNARSFSALHYQWYTFSSDNGEGTPIEGAVSSTYTHTAIKDQAIYCEVRDDAGNSAEVSFFICLIREPSEADFAAASVITAGEEKEVRTTERDFARFFKFTPDKTGAYSVGSVVPLDDSNTTPKNAEIYDENHESLNTVSEDHSWYDFRYTFMADAGKTYYIRTWSYDYLPAVYSIRLEGLSFYAAADGTGRSKYIYTDPFSAEEITLETDAWSDSNLYYQWFAQDDSWAEGDGTAISGANKKTFTVPDKKTCAYSCLVSDDHGNKNTLYYHIIIDNELLLDSAETDLGCAYDSTAVLSVTATARDEEGLRYSWHKYDENDEPLEISGADGPTLTTDPVRKYENYYCIVTDKFDNRSSLYFTVFVENGFDAYPDPSAGAVLDDDGVMVVKFDSTATPKALKVNVNAADKEGISYEWYYGGDMELSIGDNSPRLVPPYTGSYRCKVTDKFDNKDTVYFYVKINNDLKASAAGDTTVKACAGSSAVLRVPASALNKESIVYTWYETDKDRNDWTQIENTGTSTPGTLVIPSVDRDAYYVCEITDIYNNYCENDIYFTVKKIDPIDISGAEITVAANGLTYSGKDQTPAVTVKYDSTVLTEGTDYDLRYENSKNAGADTAKAIVTGKGNYTGTAEKTFSIAKAAHKITAKAAKSPISVSQKTTIKVTGAKGKVSYKSGKPTVATVDSKGNITAKAVGTTVITVTDAGDANYDKAAAVKVTIKVTPRATTKLTAASQAKGIKLTWAKVAGANGYILYRNNKKIKTITKGSTVTWTDTGANTNGSKYTFKVVAKAATGTSALSRSLVTYHVARPAISSAANTAAKKMTVKWKKNARASGYEIQYSLKSNFSGAKTVNIAKAATVSKVISGLQKGKTYYIRIRTYKTVSKKKYCSIWSASKKLKITK